MKARLQKFNLLVERAFFNRLGQANVMPVFLLIFLLFFSVMIAFNMHRFPPLAVMGVVAAMCVMVLTLININFGLVILIFSMLWSPEMPIGKTIERAIVLRVDDFLIIGVFFAWLGRLAFTRQTQTLRHTPINTLVFLYIGANIVSTSLGVMAGDVDAVVGFFYVLKFVEYFMLYFLFVNNITDMKQFKVFIFCFFLTAFTIGIFTYMQFGGWERPTAPFEGAHGEPNTLGGYLMLCILVAAGLYIHQRATLGKVITGGLCLFLLPPIAMTLSRSAYVGLTIGYLALLWISKRGKLILSFILILFILFFPYILPQKVLERINYTFRGRYQFQVVGEQVELEGSAAARIFNYRYAWSYLKNKPFLGYGVTGLGLIDSQYARTLGELGMIGLIILLSLLFKLYTSALAAYNKILNDFSRGLSLGYLCGFIGVLTMGLGANVFVIIRISEPFWFLAACVMALPGISGSEIKNQDYGIEGRDYLGT